MSAAETTKKSIRADRGGSRQIRKERPEFLINQEKGAEMEETREVLKETFHKAIDGMDSEVHKLKNLLIALRYGALFDRDNKKRSLDGPSWGWILDETITDAATLLVASASELNLASVPMVTATNKEMLQKTCQTYVNYANRFQNILELFKAAADDEDEGGPIRKFDWPAAFEVLLETLEKIDVSTDELLDIVLGPWSEKEKCRIEPESAA